jgi:hypothetical protein
VIGCIAWCSGCKKDSPDAEVSAEVKSQEAYEAEAKKQIDSSNMTSELERIEKEVEAEIATEQ